MYVCDIVNERGLVKILLRAMCLVDKRLVDHGSRVAYIVNRLLVLDGSYDEKQVSDLSLLAMMHDVGAYKTEEIDNMLRFETEDIWQHSVYGYLFINHFSPLSKLSEVVLYHHLNARRMPSFDTPFGSLALLFFLADRVDVCISQHQSVQEELLSGRASGRFDAGQVDLFLRADKLYSICDNLENGGYANEVENICASFRFSSEEIEQYLKMLTYLIDFRSEVTVTHTIMTVSLSVAIARFMGLPEDEVKCIYFGSLLHDLGKIATPVAILESPDRLSDGEMKIMKNHVTITREIIHGEIDEKIERIAVRHHEKLDGSGYPDGLPGSCLTVSERIVAVGDILSALRGQRSYKEAYTKESIVKILADMRDTGKLDSDIVTLVIEKYDEIEQTADNDSRDAIETYNVIYSEYQSLCGKLCG